MVLIIQITDKPDRFSCSPKIKLKQDPPVNGELQHLKEALSRYKYPRWAINKVQNKVINGNWEENGNNHVVSDFLMNKINFCWRRQAFASYQKWLPQV